MLPISMSVKARVAASLRFQICKVRQLMPVWSNSNVAVPSDSRVLDAAVPVTASGPESPTNVSSLFAVPAMTLDGITVTEPQLDPVDARAQTRSIPFVVVSTSNTLKRRLLTQPA